MFRRHWSGLPRDVSFPTNLKDLGYFVNEEDEIRSIDNPDNYFKYFIDKNNRVNQCQRFAFNQAMEKVIHERLEGLGLEKVRLPLGTPASKPHVPIFVEADIKNKKRVVVIFGQSVQDLGLLAGRVANGPGGIEKGSMVSVVRELRAQAATGSHDQSSTSSSSSPGVILANMGQLYWWPEAQRPLTITAKAAIPMSSLVHAGVRYSPLLNDIPQNEDPARHVDYMFSKVLPRMVAEDAVLDVIAVGDSCETVEKFLDEESHWRVWGKRLCSMVLLETVCMEETLSNAAFKDFLAKRTRCYTICPEALDMPLAPPIGNPSLSLPPLGTPIYSSSEPHHRECIFIRALKGICAYLQHNAMHPHAENEMIHIRSTQDEDEQGEGDERKTGEAAWSEVPEEEKPLVATVNPKFIEQEVQNLRNWRKYEQGQSVTAFDGPEDTLPDISREKAQAGNEHKGGKADW